MNSHEIQNVWNSPRNNLAAEGQRQLAEKFTRQMIRRRRFQAIWLLNTFVWLAIVTALAIRLIITGKVKLETEWGLLPLLFVPWAFAFHFLRRYLKPTIFTMDGEAPVIDSLRAALVSNKTNQSHLKLVGLLYLIVIPLLVLAMQQLHAVGKVSLHELISMAVFFGGMLLASAVVVAFRYFGRLLPQQKQLDALLSELTEETGNKK